MSSEVYGVNFLAFGISGLLGPSFMYIVNHSGIEVGSTAPYLFVYLGGAVLSLVSIIITIFTKEEKFNYN